MRKTTLPEEDRPHVERTLEFSRRAGWKANGIYYSEEVGNINGSYYILYPADGTPNEEIEKAAQEIRSDHDVVGMEAVMVPPEMVADDERDRPSKSAEEKIAKIRDILENGFNKVDGVAVDAFSASAIIAVYDALNDKNKAKYASYPIPFMADLAFKWINQQEQEKRRNQS